MSSGGGLLDLVARGKKDTFFTQNPKISFIHSVYQRSPAFTQEIRITQPKNNAEWNRWVDFEIEQVGDLVRAPVLLVDLPSWLPVSQEASNPTAYITDKNGVEYGYTQDVGSALIEKVQVFNDQIMLHEFWGQWLEWRTAMQKNAQVYGLLAGRHSNRTGQVSKAATPGRLRIHLPIIGCQTPDDQGFPTIAVSNQRFRIRVHLRRIEEIIEASDSRISPQPWNQTFIIKTSPTDAGTEFQTKLRSQIGGPIIALETTQIYLPRDVQDYIKKTSLYLPYTQVQLSQFTIQDTRWDPVVTNGVTVSVPLQLDFIGSIQRITVGVQTEASILAGQRYQMNPPTGGAERFLQSLRLNVGTQDRLNTFSSDIWSTVSNYYKNQLEPRDPAGGAFNIYTLALGSAETTKPLGTFNMSRTQNGILYINLAAIATDPRLNSRQSTVYVFGEAWNIFEIKDGRGKMLFAD
jgi:hypothetical protein